MSNKSHDKPTIKWLTEELNSLAERNCLRTLKAAEPLAHGLVRSHGRELLNLSANNYLGLAEVLSNFIHNHHLHTTWGGGASRLVTGNHPVFAQLEAAVANLKGTEAALIFSSGYMANIGVIPALMKAGDAIYSDRLNHASIIDGIRLSRAQHIRYRHVDMDHLETLLQKGGNYRRKLIISESVFSMDGDMAPLAQLASLKERYGAMLMIDEAHSGGLYGPDGAGLAGALQVSAAIDVQMGTFSKAYGGYGAYVAGRRVLIDYLINHARSVIYTTGLPPLLIAANLEAINRVKKEPWRREKLFANIRLTHQEMSAWPGVNPRDDTPIFPLVIGDDGETARISQFLWESGIAAIAIRPPTVPKGSARLRLSLSAAHRPEDLLAALKKIKSILVR